MRVGQNYFPKSSFLSVEKDLALICNKILENQRLCKLLYYTDRDCLNKPDLTTEQKMSMINRQIKIVPKIDIESDSLCPNYLVITFNNFLPNSNPEFRDFKVKFDILCNTDHWLLGNFNLRPYKIAGEIDSMINNVKLTGIGTLQFSGADDFLMDERLCGLTLVYDATHGIDDKINGLV